MKYLNLNKLLNISTTAGICLLTSSIQAAQPVANGDFELGSVGDWVRTQINDGYSGLVQKGTCFSSYDTSGLPLRGNYSAILRSNASGDTDSYGILTSPGFVAGEGVAFLAMSENDAADPSDDPVTLEVIVLDSSDTVLISQDFKPSTAKLDNGCPGKGKSGNFSGHYLSTSAFKGQTIKIKFKQHTEQQGASFFTLIDQVVKFNANEQPLFYSQPHAQAGISYTRNGTPRLDAEYSFDRDNKPFDLSYTWRIGSSLFRKGRRPCVGDLIGGAYEAVLYVNDGVSASSDWFTFVVQNQSGTVDPNTSDDTTTDDDTPITTLDTAEIGPTASDPGCSTEFDVSVSDPTDPVVTPHDVNDLTSDLEVYDTALPNGQTTLEIDTSNAVEPSNVNTGTNSGTGANGTGTITTTGAVNITTTAIRWKPVSESDGNLVVLTPSSFASSSARLGTSTGAIIETGTFVGRTNPDRATYRFSKPGAEYAGPVYLEVNGSVYLVQTPSVEINK